MNTPNTFLLGHVEANCFCQRCRHERYDIIVGINYPNNRLRQLFTNDLVMEEEDKLYMLYHTTLEKVLYGKVFMESSLNQEGKKYFRPWARRHFPHLTEEKLNEFVENVKRASTVFDKWDTIVENLTDSRLTYIDARRFSVLHFWRARHLNWCLNYNESLRSKGKDQADKPYPEDKYQMIFQHIKNSGILDDIDNDPQTASCIGGRLQSDMVRLANTRYRPY